MIEPTNVLLRRYAERLAAHVAGQPVRPRLALLAKMIEGVQDMVAGLADAETEPEQCPECGSDEITGTGEHNVADEQEREIWQCSSCDCEWVPGADTESRESILCAVSFIQGALWGADVLAESDLIPVEVSEAPAPPVSPKPPSRLLPFPFLATRVTTDD